MTQLLHCLKLLFKANEKDLYLLKKNMNYDSNLVIIIILVTFDRKMFSSNTSCC